MDVNKCIISIIILILATLFVSLIAGVIQNIVDINNKITEISDDISLLKITSNNTLLAMNSYYSTIRETQTEIEKKLLTEIACLATKNNNDMKELKEKIIFNNQDNALKKNNIKNKQRIQYRVKYKHPFDNTTFSIVCNDREELQNTIYALKANESIGFKFLGIDDRIIESEKDDSDYGWNKLFSF